MKTLPLRLTPGQDLREALEAAVRAQGCQAAFVLSSEWAFTREPDAATGYAELVVKAREGT